MDVLKKVLWILTVVLAFLIVVYSVVVYFLMGAEQAGFVQTKLLEMNLDSLWYLMLSIHIAGSILALMIGPFTLSPKFREKNVKLHRMLGRIYLLGILFGGGAGFYLAFYASGGITGKLGFGTLSVIWILTAFQALRKILGKKVHLHRQWMIRNYSLTFAAVTLRIWLPVFVVVVISWLAWVPNLIIAELYLRRKLRLTSDKKFLSA